MWRSYMIYKCKQCGFERKTDRKIYKFDDDQYHMQAYSEDKEMRESQSRAQSGPCPRCGADCLTFDRWSRW